MASHSLVNIGSECCVSMSYQMGNTSSKGNQSKGTNINKSHDSSRSSEGLPADPQDFEDNHSFDKDILAEGKRSFLEGKAKRERNLVNIWETEVLLNSSNSKRQGNMNKVKRDFPCLASPYDDTSDVQTGSILSDPGFVDHSHIPEDVSVVSHAAYSDPGVFNNYRSAVNQQHVSGDSLPSANPSQTFQDNPPQNRSFVDNKQVSSDGCHQDSSSVDHNHVAHHTPHEDQSCVDQCQAPPDGPNVDHPHGSQNGPDLAHNRVPHDDSLEECMHPNSLPVNAGLVVQASPSMGYVSNSQNRPGVANREPVQNVVGTMPNDVSTAENSTRQPDVAKVCAVRKNPRKAMPQEQVEYIPDESTKDLSVPPTPKSKVESHTPHAMQFVSGRHQEESYKKEIQESIGDKSKATKLLVSKCITDNTLLLEKLSKYLDRESRAIKCWKHLAYVLGVPTEETRKFDVYTERSPTEDLFNYLVTWNPDLTVGDLKAVLQAGYRNDVIESLEKGNYTDRMKICDLFLGDARFISILAPKLDIESRSIGNWRKLGADFGIHKTKLDQFGLPHHGPTAMLFCYLETAEELRQLNMGQLRGHLQAMERKDVILILDKYDLNDSSLVREMLKADSELLDEISDRLNKEMRAIKNWRNLAFRLKIPYEVYSTFDASKGRAKSATKLLFHWLANGKPLLTVEHLLKGLKQIERFDVVDIVSMELERGGEMSKKAEKSKHFSSSYSKDYIDGPTKNIINDAASPLSSTGQVFTDLKQLKAETDQVRKKVDLPSDLEKNAKRKGFIIVDNPGSGDCMFYALADQLKLVRGFDLSHRDLRQKLVAFLEAHPKLANGTDLMNFVYGYKSWADYLQDVKAGGTWGDEVVLFAAANHFHVPIRVVSSLPNHNDVYIRPESPAENTDPLVLGHIHEEHYVSLRPAQAGLKSASDPVREAQLTSAQDHQTPSQGSASKTSQGVREPTDGTFTQANAVTRITDIPRCNPFCAQQTYSVQNLDPTASKTPEMIPSGNSGLQQGGLDPQRRQDRKQRLDVLVMNLPYHVYSKVCMKLDIKRDFFDDFRMLAEYLGMDRDYIRVLEQNKNPTHSIFSSCTVTLTVDSLIKALHRIERFDVAKLLEDWVQEHDMK